MRLIVRTPSRAPTLPDAQVAQASYADPDAARAALAGIEVVFMVSGSEPASRLADHLRFVRAAAEAGVKHVVYTSFAAADPNSTFTLARDHHATEEGIRAAGMGFTFLRDNFWLITVEGVAAG